MWITSDCIVRSEILTVHAALYFTTYFPPHPIRSKTIIFALTLRWVFNVEILEINSNLMENKNKEK